MKAQQKYTKEQVRDILLKFKDFLESDSGFVIMFSSKNNQVTDVYHNICKHCVTDIFDTAIEDAEKLNLLAECQDENN